MNVLVRELRFICPIKTERITVFRHPHLIVQKGDSTLGLLSLQDLKILLGRCPRLSAERSSHFAAQQRK